MSEDTWKLSVEVEGQDRIAIEELASSFLATYREMVTERPSIGELSLSFEQERFIQARERDLGLD